MCVYTITDQDVCGGPPVDYAFSSHQWIRKTCGKDIRFFWDDSAWIWAAYGKGNRNPIVIVNGEKGLNPIIIEPETEEELQLNASKSVDPDKDKLTFHWWILPEAGTYTSTVSIREADKANAILRIPQDAAGKELHIICEVTDNGTPALTSYRRVIIRPKLGETFNLSGQR